MNGLSINGIRVNTPVIRAYEQIRLSPVDVESVEHKTYYTIAPMECKPADMLHKRISKLQPFDRAIVLLWLENLPYEEIGQIVGISTKNVSVRLFRIREQLKQMSND